MDSNGTELRLLRRCAPRNDGLLRCARNDGLFRRYAGRKGRGGFTLIEALVASVLLGMAAAVLCALTTRCLLSTRLNRDHELAWQVLDRQLRLVDTMGIDAYVAQGEREGIAEMGGRVFSWQIAVSREAIGNLYEVTVTVGWVENKRSRRITASTMLNGQIPGAMVSN